ncbi:MAG: acyl-CoA dehydrogenase [Xanthobacteraceae bacterium]|uniref:acyl-CoA dehydrogenase n=1 Tax=Pseudolabrys sp. TaxID=1960880 RepID=UPI003D0D6778
MAQSWRRDTLTRPIFRWARTVLPDISETEREALEAGDVWWDAELFAGNPDWYRLRATPQAKLSAEEQAFLAGPVEELCAMLDDWRINWELGDLPSEAWAFIKRHKFFGMIIPKEHGGLGFSATAHSEVVRKVSTRSIAGAVTIMVPNSLGPGELLMQFGTDAQRATWLPRLADGREVPCFSLTSPEAGSDAASMIDNGVVIRQSDGQLGIRLNWRKRYITLGPVATVMGLAFKLRDPDRLLGGEEDLGITVALVPTDLPGIKIGRRHLPSHQVFQNGPNEGHDVVIPVDNIIGGAAQAGKGWRMLMSALAAGRGISLPSLSAAGAAFALRTTSAYARVRYQFNVPIGKFEGVQRRLARQAGTAYILDAGRRLTCAGLDEGRKLAVISAIMKAHATDRMREVVTDAMDVHAGKGVIDGPHNYLGNLYRAIPVGITVEGANILTQNLIIFGQGAIRCHPFLLREMMALQDEDTERGLTAFDEAFWGHVWHSVKTLGRALLRSWSFGWLSPAPAGAGRATKYYRQLGRYAAGFALTADLALLTLGGALKRKELLSARLGGILSELFLLSAALKRYEDEGRQESDRAVLSWCMADGFATIERRFMEVFSNLPNRPVAWLLNVIVQPLGPQRRGPSDRLTIALAEQMMAPSPLRDRLTADIDLGAEGVALLERAFTLTVEAEPLRQKLRRDGIRDWREAAKSGALSEAEVAQLTALEHAVAKVIAVDDFAADAFARPAGSPSETPAKPKTPAKPRATAEAASVRPAGTKRSKPDGAVKRAPKPPAS